MGRIYFFLLSILFLNAAVSGVSSAEDALSLGDKAISSSFKALAKAYTYSIDLEAIKKAQIKRIERMSQEKFEKRQKEIYGVIKNLSPNVQKQYNISAHMSKSEVVADIESLDKRKIYELIDAFPDRVIVEEFYKYCGRLEQQVNLHHVWNNIIQKTKN